METLPVVLAPSITGKNYNKIRKALISVACWKLESVRFAFGSSFILPDTQKDFAAFSAIRRDMQRMDFGSGAAASHVRKRWSEW